MPVSRQQPTDPFNGGALAQIAPVLFASQKISGYFTCCSGDGEEKGHPRRKRAAQPEGAVTSRTSTVYHKSCIL